MESKETCAICLGTLNVGGGQALFTAECSHSFHFSCIASNVQHGNHLCPTCRATWVNLPSQFTPTDDAPYKHSAPAPAPAPLILPPFPDYETLPPPSPVAPTSLPLHSFADDETLPPPSPVAPTTFSTPQNDDRVTVKALPEYPALSNSYQSNSFPVLVAIQAPPLSPEAFDRPTYRASLDLVAVLDVSESMDGDKIMLLKQAVGFVADNLGPSDRLSVITFSTSARRVTPLRRMTDAGRSDTIRAVNKLRAKGTTNIVGGLKLGVEVLMQRREKNPVSSIILLSDGQDNQISYHSSFLHSLCDLPPCIRSNYVHLATNVLRTDVVPVYTFGFGVDHDATALHAIADGSGGTFSYIESIEIIQDAFARCIGGLLSVVSQELEIHLNSASQGVQIQSISSGRYRNNIDSGGLHGMVYVGEVFAEEKKKFLAYLSLPPADAETLKMQLLEVKCSYKDPLSNQNLMSENVSVEIRRPITEDLTEEDKQVCLELDRERNRVSIAEGIAEAQAMAERGELSRARATLEQWSRELRQSASAQAGDALCGRLEREMDEIHRRMSSRLDYEEGGRAYTLSIQSAHMNQRASTHFYTCPLPRQRQDDNERKDAVTQPMDRWSSPIDEPEYQTSFMSRMVRKSQELLFPRKKDEKSAASSSSNSMN